MHLAKATFLLFDILFIEPQVPFILMQCIVSCKTHACIYCCNDRKLEVESLPPCFCSSSVCAHATLSNIASKSSFGRTVRPATAAEEYL